MRQPTPDEWATISDQFDRLSPLPRREQDARIERAALGAFVTSRVRALLDASHAEGVLDRSAVPRPSSPDPVPLPAGSVIGRFRTVRLIGRGGSGEVYLAERDKAGFAQRVALKLLRVEAGERIAAFDAERGLLATLEHPGIARLIDGGTAPDGRPYMAMEYVEGEPIAAWCAAQAADVTARLNLLVAVCDAVAYAHARLIIHRDIKPGNILIDREGRARLLDFGIAKVVNDDAIDRGAAGPALTPDYAAPEQLENGATTVATDVFALGAVLHELLTGSPPWRGVGGHLPAIVRRMPDEMPPPPSEVARSNTDPPVPARRIAGDLDAIVARAMQPSPDRRYPTADALADDLRRHLHLAPVAARAGSPGYAVGRFVRRYRWAVAAACLAVLAIVGGAIGFAWQAHRIAIERDIARNHADRIEAVNQAILLMFRDASDASQLKTLSVGDMIDGTTRRILHSLPPESPDAAPTIAALADLYLITEDNADAKALLTGALQRGIGRTDPVNSARLKLKLGTILATEGHFADARRLLDEANAVWRNDSERFGAERVEMVGAYALMARLNGRPDQAIVLLQGGMATADQVYAGDDRNLAARYANLATLLADAGRLDEADALLTRARQRMARAGGPPSGPMLNLARQQADVTNRRGDAVRAEAMLRDAVAQRRRYYGPSIALAVDLLHLGRLLNQRGQNAEALTLLDEAAPMADEHFGSQSQPSLQIRIAQVEALAALGRAPQARALFLSFTPLQRQMVNPSLTLARYLRSRAALWLALGRTADAARDLGLAKTVAARLGRGAGSFPAEAVPLVRRLQQAGVLPH